MRFLTLMCNSFTRYVLRKNKLLNIIFLLHGTNLNYFKENTTCRVDKKSTSSIGRKASTVPVKDSLSALPKTLFLGSFPPSQLSLSQMLLSGAGLYVIGARDGPNSEDWTIKIYLPTTPNMYH